MALGGRKKDLDVGVFGARGIPSTYSGYETFLTVLLPELAARGHRVTMYCRRSSGDVGGGDFEGVRRVLLPSIETKELGTLSHGLVGAARSRVSGHDVVFIVNVANALYALAARATGQRVVMNLDGQEWLRGKWGKVAKAYFRFSAEIARISASALVTDCDAMRRIYRDQFGARSTVVPYCWTGIGSQQTNEALQSFGLRYREYFLVAGRLVPENNIERVVEAYEASGAKSPMLVLGRANYASPVEQRLRQLAARSPGIILGGHVDDRAAYATLVAGAKAYIHAHSVGGINPSLLEAMGCGARVVALATDFNREALAGTGTYFVDFGEELPALLRRISAGGATDDERMRQAARARVDSTFGLKPVADAYERLFRSVADRHPWASTSQETHWQSNDSKGTSPPEFSGVGPQGHPDG